MRIVIATTILNAVLDLLVVAGFGMGVAGAAWSNCDRPGAERLLLSLARNHERKELIRFTRGILRIRMGMLKQTLKVEFPAQCR